jgi:WD40 repeat protein
LRNWDRTTDPSTLTWVAQASGTSVLGLSITDAGSRFLVATEGGGIWAYVPDAPAPAVDTSVRIDCGGALFGPATGGTTVEVGGRYLFDATVTVGGVAATVTYVASDGTLVRFNTPAGVPGLAPVVLATSSGSVTLADRFEYLAAPRGWEMVGSTIRGSGSWEWGESVDLSADGHIMVMSSPYADASVSQSGAVRVYERTGSGWVQRGVDIAGSETNEKFGSSVAISQDGSIVAVGAREFSGTGGDDRIGAVRVYRWSGGTWALVGAEIRGSLGDTAFFGRSVALSSDGETLAVGANGADAVRVYRLTGGSWVQLGSDLVGGAGNTFGWSVALSADGETVAVGAHAVDIVQVYRFAGGSWVQLGGDLTGGAGDVFGWSVKLSADGETVVVGTPEYVDSDENGEVSVFDFDGSAWSQRGLDMRGGVDAYAGVAVDISADGNVVAYSMPYRCEYEYYGSVAVREWNGSTWAMRGEAIQATTGGNGFGEALAMNASGNMVAVSDKYGLASDGAVTVWSQSAAAAAAAVAAAPNSVPAVEPEQSPVGVAPIIELPETGGHGNLPSAFALLATGAALMWSGARRRRTL